MAKDTETTPDGNAALADALLAAIQKLQPQGGGLTDAQLEKILVNNSESTRKALKPENARHPDISAFSNPKGERDDPKDKLTRKTFWAGNELHEDELTPTEIQLFNSFTHSTEARNGSWRAELRTTGKDGTKDLHISFPCATTDDRMELPNGMTLICRELLGGEKAVDPESLAKQVAELQKRLEALSPA